MIQSIFERSETIWRGWPFTILCEGRSDQIEHIIDNCGNKSLIYSKVYISTWSTWYIYIDFGQIDGAVAAANQSTGIG